MNKLQWMRLVSRCVAICTFAFCLHGHLVHAQTNKVAIQLAEHTLSPIGKEAADQVAKELVESAVSMSGKEAVEQTSKTLQTQLAATISKYGDAVVSLARRIPEATQALATRAPQLLPMAERLGDDIVRIEARAPGYAEMAAKAFGKDELPRLLKLPKPEMEGVLRLSSHIIEPRAAKLLLEGSEKGGINFLEKISGTQILATGLSAAAILAVMEGMGKIPPGQETAKTMAGEVRVILLPITAVGACLFAVWGGLAIWRKHKQATRN